MGTISEEILRLNNAKAALKSSIEAKGVTVPSSATLDTYYLYVNQISGDTPVVDYVVTLTLTGGTTSSVTYNDGIVPSSAFTNRNDIESVEIGSGITSIGNMAFANNGSLTSVTIGSGVTSLPNYVFGEDYYLSALTCYAITAPTLGTTPFVGLPSNGTLYVPYGSDYSSWIGPSNISNQYLASGWTISYMNAPTSYIELYDYSYNDGYITFNISWQGGSSSVTYNNGYALVEVPIETDITITPSFDEAQYIEDAQCDGTPMLMVSLQMEINVADGEDGKGVDYYIYMEDPENYPNAVYTYKDPSDSIVINFLESGETANVGISSMSQVDFNCEPFMEEPEPEPEPEEPIEE